MAAGGQSRAIAGEAEGDTLAVKASAEVETKVSLNGRETIKLVPADRVVPGDEVIYTLEIRNTGAAPVLAPSVRFAIPHHMRYIADSAAGPGAQVSFSVDGGRTFDLPENLQVPGKAGRVAPGHRGRLHPHPVAIEAAPQRQFGRVCAVSRSSEIAAAKTS